MVTEPSHPLRMTINVSLTMTPFPPIVILNGDKMPCKKNGKWDGGTERRIYYAE